MYQIKGFLKKNILLLSLTVIALIVFLTNLGGQGYSLDEPLTVALARTILKFGYPSTWDGTIFLSATNGLDTTLIHGMYFWSWHPWLQFYLIAPFYFFFHNSLAILRIPFALLGVATVSMFYFVMQKLFKNKWISALVSLQLIFLLPFFLYIRQIHYYSPTAFLSIVIFWLLIREQNNKFTKKSLFWILLSLLLLFMTNYLTWLSCLPFIFGYCFKKRIKSLFIVLVVNCIFAALWFHFLNPFHGDASSAYPRALNIIQSIIHYTSYVNSFIFPCILVPFVIFTAWKLKLLRLLAVISGWIVIKIVVYSFLVDTHGRFLVDIMPFFLLLYGFLYSYLWQKKQIPLVLFIACVIMTTNVISLIPVYFSVSKERQLRLYPEAFASELTGNYTTAYTQVDKYLLSEVKPRDLFYSDYAVLDTYLDTNIPTLSSLCDLHQWKFIGPKSITQPKNVRWYIFFQGGTQPLANAPCLGEKWQKYMLQHYRKKIFYLSPNTYNINDTDIVNREIPPIPRPNQYVVIYERVN